MLIKDRIGSFTLSPSSIVPLTRIWPTSALFGKYPHLVMQWSLNRLDMYYLNLLPPTMAFNHVVARANTAYQCYGPCIPTMSLTFVDIAIIICKIDMLFEVPLRMFTIMLIV